MLVRTTLQPWKEIEVDERECQSLKDKGLLVEAPETATDKQQVSDSFSEPDEDSEAPRYNEKETDKWGL